MTHNAFTTAVVIITPSVQIDSVNIMNSLYDDKIKLCRLQWLGHVLRMEPHRLPHRALFPMPQTR